MKRGTWESVKLGDAGTWLSGGTPSTTDQSLWHGDLPWISAKSLTEFYLKDSDRRLSEHGVQNGGRVVGKDAILMVVRGMSLKTEFRMGIARRALAFSQDCKALVARRGIDPQFLAYALKAKTPEVLAMVDEAGHGTGRLQMDRLFKLEIGVPAITEQRGIAKTLGLLDDKIESNQQAIQSTSELLDAVAAKAAAEIPRTNLGALVTVLRDTVNPLLLADEVVDHYSLPAFDDRVRPERMHASTIMSNKLEIARHSILLSRLNPRFNRTWWVTPDPGFRAVASTEFLCLTASDDDALAGVWLAVRDPGFQSELARRVTGTSGSHQRVRPDDVLAINVPDVTQLPAGTRFAARAALECIMNNREEISSLTKLRDSLLPALMSGSVRVPEAVAEVLV